MKKAIVSMVLLGCSLCQVVQAEWVYIGEYGADGSISLNFDVQGIPVVGETIRAEKAMNLRDDRPRIKRDQWTLGDVVGVIYRGEQFVIEEVAISHDGSVPGDVWVKGVVKQ